jgi:ADP-ribose pyrophosphatase YjhB (NUDIX family)
MDPGDPDPEAAARREGAEELRYKEDGKPFVPQELHPLGAFRKEDGGVSHAFLARVPPDFAERIDVLEGAGGVFHSCEEIGAEPLVSGSTRARVAAAFAEIDRQLAALTWGASILPWAIREDGEPVAYLQIRTDDAPRDPGYLGLFGGHREAGETAEENAGREAAEELMFDGAPFVPAEMERLGIYLSPTFAIDVFLARVPPDFAARTRVREGKEGRFFTEAEALAFSPVRPWIVERLRDAFAKIRMLKFVS